MSSSSIPGQANSNPPNDRGGADKIPSFKSGAIRWRELIGIALQDRVSASCAAACEGQGAMESEAPALKILWPCCVAWIISTWPMHEGEGTAQSVLMFNLCTPPLHVNVPLCDSIA